MSLGILEAVAEDAADALLRAEVGRDADAGAGISVTPLPLASDAEDGLLRRGIFDGEMDPDRDEVVAV